MRLTDRAPRAADGPDLNSSPAPPPRLHTSHRPRFLSPGSNPGASYMASAPILQLREGILWFMFLLLADMEQDNEIHGTVLYSFSRITHDHALTTLRRVSQVCSLWRRALLSSSSLWARVVNLDLLQQRTDHWRAEVARRTGAAPLVIRGTAITDPGLSLINCVVFFSSFLRSNWKRVRVFDIEGAVGETFMLPQMEFWSVLHQPAKQLEHFRLDTGVRYTLPPPWRPLFGGHAPSLRFLSCSRLTFEIQEVPWLSQLRELCLVHWEGYAVDLAIPKMLQVLKGMHYLTSLTLQKAFTRTQQVHNISQVVSLPQLHHLVIEDTLATCAGFLESIHPSPRCCLHLRSYESLRPLEPADPNLQSISRYISNYFSQVSPSGVEVRLQNSQCSILESRILPIHTCTRNFAFDITPEYPDIFVPPSPRLPNLLPGFLNILSPHPFSRITTLDIECAPFTHTLSGANPEFLQFLLSFEALETLSTIFSTLNLVLNGLLAQDVDLFPLLRSLRIREIITADLSGPYVENAFTQFLGSRAESGRPVEVLDLRPCGRKVKPMGFLEAFAGLEVRWRNLEDQDEEYTCGAGESEVLDHLDLRWMERLQDDAREWDLLEGLEEEGDTDE
ncbi:unnamed protein product [Cyclocybe aegerita]|uniref:F-box domain-containing protein n=1 Tax=Cyclocybe aegerita TaxID=1973307 RepID=A0A8S0VU25_CYCAE|nr:unnamed protein product [Cyclocybe aegerita]